MISFKKFIKESHGYGEGHTAPTKESGTPIHNASPSVYPDDFHGPSGFRYYADYGNPYDHYSYRQLTRVKNDPEAHVWIHRAIPMDVKKAAMKTDNPIGHMIRPGDWVTPSKDYAKDHGENEFGKGKYHIASRRVKAKHVYTDGNSVHEWGYDPT